MEAIKLIGTAVAMIIGLFLTPIVANATYDAIQNNSTRAIPGLVTILQLVPYIYVFVIIGAGLVVMYKFYKGT